MTCSLVKSAYYPNTTSSSSGVYVLRCNVLTNKKEKTDMTEEKLNILQKEYESEFSTSIKFWILGVQQPVSH